MHEAILASVGLDLGVEECQPEQVRETVSNRRARAPDFRDLILRIYERRCAFCGYGGRLADELVGLDAAHVRWHAAGGPDTEDNGVAACAIHHRALDLGAISISNEHRVWVSELYTCREPEGDWILPLSGRRLHAPQRGHPMPAPEHLAWHHREVFRTPPRE